MHAASEAAPDSRPPPAAKPGVSEGWWRLATHTPGRDRPASSSGVPDVVHEVLEGGSEALAAADRSRFETALDSDLGKVRIHTGQRAAESADFIGALAYSFGTHVVLGADARAGTPEREVLLGHELAHVASPAATDAASEPETVAASGTAAELDAHSRGTLAAMGARAGRGRAASRPNAIHRFEKGERGRIGSLSAVVATARAMAEKSMVRTFLVTGIDWPTFTKHAGGSDAFDFVLDKAGVPRSGPAMLDNRYTFTCQCGLIDMRHFYQLMYIAMVRNNPKATQMGREHELKSEATSRFAPEDTPSNALGAFFGSQLPVTMQPDELASQLQGYLDRCGPVDFTAMSPADQDLIVNYYGDRKADLSPANPNETAVPATLGVAACGAASRTYPFIVEPGDQKTITDTEHLKSDSEIRDWITAHDAATILGVSTTEKVRLVNRLFDGWVSDDDVSAIETIMSNLSAADKAAVRALIARRVDDLSSVGQRTRLRAALTRL